MRLTLVISGVDGTPVEALIQVNIEVPDGGEIVIPFCVDWDSNTGVVAGTTPILTAPWSASVVSCTTSCQGRIVHPCRHRAKRGVQSPAWGVLDVTSFR